MIGRAAFGRAPRRFRDFSFQRYHLKIGSFHEPNVSPAIEPRIDEIRASNSALAYQR
jgi:hypothetical protein